MAVYNNFIVTNNGKKQYAKAISGTKLNFTQVKLGIGKPAATPEELTDIVSLVARANIASIDTATQEGVARITIEVSNTGFQTEIGIREIGVFCNNADDSTEVMYAYLYSDTDIDVLPSAAYGDFTWKMTIALAISNAEANTGGGSSAFANFTPSVTVTPKESGTIFVDVSSSNCKYSHVGEVITAFYNLTGTLYTMENAINGITSFKISLPQGASLNAPILCNLVVGDTIVDAEAKIDAANDVIDIQYFGTVNGAFTLTALAQYLA